MDHKTSLVVKLLKGTLAEPNPNFLCTYLSIPSHQAVGNFTDFTKVHQHCVENKGAHFTDSSSGRNMMALTPGALQIFSLNFSYVEKKV